MKMRNLKDRIVDIDPKYEERFLKKGFKKVTSNDLEKPTDGVKNSDIENLDNDLEKLKAEELKELAKELGIEYTNKKEVIEKIKAKQ